MIFQILSVADFFTIYVTVIGKGNTIIGKGYILTHLLERK